MTKLEAANNLVKLFADYEHVMRKDFSKVNYDYSEAVAMACMSLTEEEGKDGGDA